MNMATSMRASRQSQRFIAAVVLLTPVCIAAAPPAALAQRDSSALINEALDKPVEVQLKTTLPNALQEIKNRTGVPIELAPGVLDLLPWGEQTNIDAKVSNQTLRQAVSAIARKLGLIYVLTPEAVELRPMPALQRLGRRATVDELGVLDLLASNPLQGATAPPPAAPAAGAQGGRQTISQLLQAVDQRLIELKSPFAIEYRAGTSGVKDNQPISVPRNATIAEALDAVAKETPLGWGPWGHSVLVKPKETWVRDQLDKPITRRFVGVDVAQVLDALAESGGVEVTIEPGAFQRLPQPARRLDLDLVNTTIREALDKIGGFTGLNWTANENGVYVWNPSTTAGGTGGGAGSGDPVVAILPLADRGIEVMIRQSEVPDELRQYIRHRKGKAIDQLRQQMKAEGFVPATTQPATQPSGEPKDL
jgi:hypothetical protein